ncbi:MULTISPECIES: iron chaperone [Sorangium]|uniref:iron chaperone n=1 Tax=Sorangium TaxID=39643 RepID=UPI003D9C5379
MPAAPTTIDEYIAACPEAVRPALAGIRDAIRRVLPDAEERIRYGMPAIMFDGRHAIHFAAWKKHIGLYPIYRSDDPIQAEIEPYRDGKDGVKFRLDRPVPYDLVERMVRMLAAHHGAGR